MGKIDKGDNVANKEMTRLRREVRLSVLFVHLSS